MTSEELELRIGCIIGRGIGSMPEQQIEGMRIQIRELTTQVATEQRRACAELVINYRQYEGLTEWGRWDQVPYPDADKIASAILRLPDLPPENEV